MRIFAISDLHVDYPDNLDWVVNLSNSDYQADVIIIAGDVTDDFDLLTKTLTLFKQKFHSVFYVPGNHELWIKNTDFPDSIAKLSAILKRCQELGIETTPKTIGPNSQIRIVPILSWYVRPEESSLRTLYWPKRGDDPSLSSWSDTYRTKWPQGCFPADYFMSLNDDPHLINKSSIPVISFSHFLPHEDLMRVFGMKIHTDRIKTFNFSRVAGDTEIEKRIKQFGSCLHIYGHHHRNQLKHINGVYYASACLGYPYEKNCRNFWQLDNSGPLLIFEDDMFTLF